MRFAAAILALVLAPVTLAVAVETFAGFGAVDCGAGQRRAPLDALGYGRASVLGANAHDRSACAERRIERALELALEIGCIAGVAGSERHAVVVQQHHVRGVETGDARGDVRANARYVSRASRAPGRKRKRTLALASRAR